MSNAAGRAQARTRLVVVKIFPVITQIFTSLLDFLARAGDVVHVIN